MGVLAAWIGVGCGGGGGGSEFITQANAANYTDAAKMLAARSVTGAWIPTALAMEIDADLKRIREKYPVLQHVQPNRDYVMTDVVVATKLDAPWRTGWNGRVLATGDAKVDEVLKGFNATAVAPDATFADRQQFTVKMAQPLNVPACAVDVAASSPFIVYARETGKAGDGDRITLERNGSVKVYTLSHGWGDCATGCIFRHYWKVTLQPDGTMTLEESGDDLSLDKNWPG